MADERGSGQCWSWQFDAVHYAHRQPEYSLTTTLDDPSTWQAVHARCVEKFDENHDAPSSMPRSYDNAMFNDLPEDYMATTCIARRTQDRLFQRMVMARWVSSFDCRADATTLSTVHYTNDPTVEYEPAAP